MVLPSFFLILKQLVNKDTQRKLVPEAFPSSFVFLERLYYASKSLFYYFYFYFNLIQDYSNLLCMKENFVKIKYRIHTDLLVGEVLLCQVN